MPELLACAIAYDSVAGLVATSGFLLCWKACRCTAGDVMYWMNFHPACCSAEETFGLMYMPQGAESRQVGLAGGHGVSSNPASFADCDMVGFHSCGPGEASAHHLATRPRLKARSQPVDS